MVVFHIRQQKNELVHLQGGKPQKLSKQHLAPQ